jgi:hypothetical protein
MPKEAKSKAEPMRYEIIRQPNIRAAMAEAAAAGEPAEVPEPTTQAVEIATPKKGGK